MEQIQIADGHNPYANYDPAGLLRAWGNEQTSVQRNVKAVGQAIERRQPTDPPLGTEQVVRALRDNRQRMGQIYEVALDMLEAMRVYCWGENKQTVIAYSTAVAETGLTAVAGAIQVWNTSKDDGEASSWWPFGIVTVSGFASIVKNYAWEKKIEAEVDLAKVEATITASGLKFVDGMIDSLDAMGKMGAEAESSVSEHELEKRLRRIGRLPANADIDMDAVMGQVQHSRNFTAKADSQGADGRLRTLAGLVIERQKRAQTQVVDGVALRAIQDGESHNWHHEYKKQAKRQVEVPLGGYQPDGSEEERRVQLWKDFVEPTCCGYLVNVGGIESKALQLRATLDQQVESAGESDEQRDFSILIQLLENVAAEGQNDVLFVLDRFLREEGVWLGKPISQVKTWSRLGAHYVTQVATMILLGVDAYQNKTDSTNRELEVLSTVGIIASLILGKYSDVMYRALVERRVREGKLRGLRRHVLKTISQSNSLVPFFQSMQELRQRQTLTQSDTEQALLGARVVPRRFRMIANSCVQDVVVPRSPSGTERQGPAEGSLLGKALAELWTDQEDGDAIVGVGVSVVALEEDAHAHDQVDRARSDDVRTTRRRRKVTVLPDSEDEMNIIRSSTSRVRMVIDEESPPVRQDHGHDAGMRRRVSRRAYQVHRDPRESDSDIELEMRIIGERQQRVSQSQIQLDAPRPGRHDEVEAVSAAADDSRKVSRLPVRTQPGVDGKGDGRPQTSVV